jgi:hypothetical protein
MYNSALFTVHVIMYMKAVYIYTLCYIVQTLLIMFIAPLSMHFVYFLHCSSIYPFLVCVHCRIVYTVSLCTRTFIQHFVHIFCLRSQHSLSTHFLSTNIANVVWLHYTTVLVCIASYIDNVHKFNIRLKYTPSCPYTGNERY